MTRRTLVCAGTLRALRRSGRSRHDQIIHIHRSQVPAFFDSLFQLKTIFPGNADYPTSGA